MITHDYARQIKNLVLIYELKLTIFKNIIILLNCNIYIFLILIDMMSILYFKVISWQSGFNKSTWQFHGYFHVRVVGFQ